MNDFRYIDSNRSFLSYLEKFETRKKYVVALDIEANSNRHAYGYQLALIQVNDGEEIVIADPFKIRNRFLKKFFENRNILKVMYDAGYDMHLLKNANGINLKSVLDLKPAVDLLDFEKRDLHSIIFSELGVKLENKRKYQEYNWLRRPISADALEYASDDVIYLLRLKDSLLEKVSELKKIDDYILNNIRVQNKDYTEDRKEVYKRVKGFYQLAEDEKELFRKLFYIRDTYAREVNMASHNVINNQELLRMARQEISPDELMFPRKIAGETITQLREELINVYPNGKTDAGI